MKGKTWNVDISVDQTWIDDGFELSEEKLKDAILDALLGYATDSEIDVSIKNVLNKVR